jgi:hypothetical protein
LTESHCYFNFSWDISWIYKNLHTHKHQLARQLGRAVQKNALLHKQLGLDKQPNSFGNYSLWGSTHINTQWQPHQRLTSLQGSHSPIILDLCSQKNCQA